MVRSIIAERQSKWMSFISFEEREKVKRHQRNVDKRCGRDMRVLFDVVFSLFVGRVGILVHVCARRSTEARASVSIVRSRIYSPRTWMQSISGTRWRCSDEYADERSLLTLNRQIENKNQRMLLAIVWRWPPWTHHTFSSISVRSNLMMTVNR